MRPEARQVPSLDQLERFLEAQPRVALLDRPTPLVEAPRLAERLGLERLLIKRDDLAAATFPDNKLRKLEYIMGAVLERGYDTVVTGGWVHSNHARQAALLCARLGVECILVIKGEAADSCPSLELLSMLGAHVVRVPRTIDFDAREKLLKQMVQEARRKGARPYLCALGGTEPRGTLGSVRGGLELEEQLVEAGVERAVVFVANASGGTHAGLVAASSLRGTRTQVVGVSATKKTAVVEGFTRRALAGLFALLGTSVTPNRIRLEIDDGFAREPARGQRSLADAIAMALTTESILVEPQYTAKVLATLRRRVELGRLDRAVTPVVYHTGGTAAYFCQ